MQLYFTQLYLLDRTSCTDIQDGAMAKCRTYVTS